jgi:peptidoglycan/LPS O-acetylase OafA/YrhL
MKKTFVRLDLLRFLLAVYLMVFHTFYIYPQSEALPLSDLLRLGGFATSTFFLLSGFILAHVYFGDATATLRGGAGAFFVKRLANLYPIHLISLALFLLVSLAGVNPINRFALSTLDGAAGQSVLLGGPETAFNVLMNVSMLHAWDPRYLAINPPSWSLSTLLFFYLMFPLLGPRLLRARHKVALLAALWIAYLIPPIAASAMQWSGAVAVGLIETNPLIRLPEFLSGILLYGLLRETRLDWLTASAWRTIGGAGFVVLSCGGAVLLLKHGAWYWQYIVHNGLLMPAEMVLIALCAGGAEPAWLARSAARLGNAALSIFAIHLPLFLLFLKLQKLFSIGTSPLACVHHFSACIAASKGVAPSMAAYPVFLIAAVVLAVLFQERVVVPLRNGLRRKLLQQRVTAGAELPLQA